MNKMTLNAYFDVKQRHTELETEVNERLEEVIKLIHDFYRVTFSGWCNGSTADNPYIMGAPKLIDNKYFDIMLWRTDPDNTSKLERNDVDFNTQIPINFLYMSNDAIITELKHNSAYSNDQVNPEDY